MAACMPTHHNTRFHTPVSLSIGIYAWSRGLLFIPDFSTPEKEPQQQQQHQQLRDGGSGGGLLPILES